MAEITFKSAGVKTREIDLSQPSRTGPVGVPAGIIGTAQEGPAFVPLTFANYSDFITTFGASDGKKFGPIAVNQWLSNAQAVTYMRVLGAGNGKQRNTSTGKVTNAGFTVGNKIVQESGLVGSNAYASGGLGDTEGRVYFLGAFMSESAGSTVFSSAGIQQGHTKATLNDAINMASFATADKLTINVPTSAGGTGVDTHILLTSADATGDAADTTNTIGIGVNGTSDAGVVAAAIVDAINGVGGNSRVTLHSRISVEPVDEEVARRAIRRLAEEWAGLAPGTVWSESGDAR